MLLVLAALAAVPAIDAVLATRPWPLAVEGALDESAHLLTAGLFLAALPPNRLRILVPWALLGAVAIDLDHIPLYLWGVGAGLGRPGTHSLTSVLVLLLFSRLAPRWRLPLSGLALGVVLHLGRDLATGPGVPLFWPAATTGVLVPYSAYLAALAGAAAVAVLRIGRRRAASEVTRPLG
ncbi:metal-dependent hydrolase [Geodermatophilus sp. TF02-6]|uniref:metal-dependent hydrolase n=1 Tax=Geodermatophilus sp. TF02-6 TaxID=2250575 RepID=UPI001314F4BD|nr:metal-dependent hydrolase [Geodermatophilus sp. TF02-6]